MTGQSIRKFFRDLFGSRVAEVLTDQIISIKHMQCEQIEMMQNDYALRIADKEVQIARLGEDFLRQRSDFEERLRDRDEIIADLRATVATLTGKVYLYETTLMPLSSRAGAEVVAAGKPKKPSFAADFNMPPVKTRWQVVQEEHNAQLEKERQEEAEQTRHVSSQAAALGGTDGQGYEVA